MGSVVETYVGMLLGTALRFIVWSAVGYKLVGTVVAKLVGNMDGADFGLIVRWGCAEEIILLGAIVGTSALGNAVGAVVGKFECLGRLVGFGLEIVEGIEEDGVFVGFLVREWRGNFLVGWIVGFLEGDFVG